MSQLTLQANERDHVQGPANAPVTLLEYGDYECPFCGAVYPTIKRLQETEGDKLRFVFRNLPLAQVHPHALAAALAAESAGLQGKFWEMHDMLYEHQDALGEEHLLSYALELDLDIDRFIDDMQADEVTDKVQEDFMSGIRSGVNGTPTFFINDKRYEGVNDYPVLVAAIEAEARRV